MKLSSKNSCLCSTLSQSTFIGGSLSWNIVTVLVTKKRNLEFEAIEVSHLYSANMSNNMVVKKKDLGLCISLCSIGLFQFVKALCDKLVSSIMNNHTTSYRGSFIQKASENSV